MDITAKGITLTESMITLISDRFAHLEGHTPNLNQSRCHITYHESYQEFECELLVHHEHKALFAKERGFEFTHTLIHMFSAMEHQLEKQKTRHSINQQNHQFNN